jgi:large subunit ribosomal protein L28
MSRVCEICGKGPMFGNSISHAHNTTKRVQYPNIQTVRVKKDGARVKMKVCASCIQAGKTIQV